MGSRRTFWLNRRARNFAHADGDSALYMVGYARGGSAAGSIHAIADNRAGDYGRPKGSLVVNLVLIVSAKLASSAKDELHTNHLATGNPRTRT